MVQLRAGALVVGPDVFFNTRIDSLPRCRFATRCRRSISIAKFAAAGGLISYGSDETEYYRLIGIYAGRILKGEKPADLPVVQSTKVEMILNLKTAKALGINVPLPLIGLADEVIE